MTAETFLLTDREEGLRLPGKEMHTPLQSFTSTTLKSANLCLNRSLVILKTDEFFKFSSMFGEFDLKKIELKAGNMFKLAVNGCQWGFLAFRASLKWLLEKLQFFTLPH